MLESIFFFLSKVLTIFLFPFPLFFLFMTVSILFTKGFARKIKLLLPVLFLYFFSNSCIANFLIGTLESKTKQFTLESAPQADTIVVLGGMIQTISIVPGRPELTDSADRLIDAVRLYQKGKAKKILFTGGSGLLFEDTYKEADLAKIILLDLGVKEEDILLESNSRNTWENATETKPILEKEKVKSILLVTSAFHMKRALGCFSKMGITVYPFPTDYRGISSRSQAFDLWIPSPGYLELSTMALKEWVGILVYSLKGNV